MTIQQIQRHLVIAAEGTPAPPTRVTVAQVYRAGLRRRRARRWMSVAAVTVTAVGVAGGVTVALTGGGASGHGGGQGPGWAGYAASPAAEQRPSPNSDARTPVSEAPPGSCERLAADVTAAAKSALPADIRWGATELPEGHTGADCAMGGIFWVSFTLRGESRRLAFEGGKGFSDSGCDPARKPDVCEMIEGGEVGHLSSFEEYGVLLSMKRGGVYFFLGISGGGRDPQPPLTTTELSVAAQRIAKDVFK